MPSAVWCSFVLTIILMDAVHASRYNSSSSSTVSSDELSGDNSETTMEKGMRPFFDMVKTFLGVVQPHKLTEQSWLSEYIKLCLLKREWPGLCMF